MPVRRRPQPDADDRIPAWVLEGGSTVAAIRRLAADPTLATAPGNAGIWAEARRNQAAAQEWCEARGLSFTMTVHGAVKPNAAEVRAGCTVGAGPKHEAAQAYLRKHGR